MAKCVFCGEQVTTGVVHHKACWKEKLEAAAEKFCDELCKIPDQCEDWAELDERCQAVCPFNELLDEGK